MGELKENNFRFAVMSCLIGVIAGSLFANIYCSNNVGEWGVFNYSFIEKMQSIHLDAKVLFRYIIWERIKVLGLFFALSFTGMRNLFEKMFGIMWGFFSGVVCSIIIMGFGTKGIVYYFLMICVAQMLFAMSVICAMRYGKLVSANGNLSEKTKWIFVAAFFLVISVFSEVFFNINFTKIFYLFLGNLPKMLYT